MKTGPQETKSTSGPDATKDIAEVGVNEPFSEMATAESTLLLRTRCVDLGFKLSIASGRVWLSQDEDRERAYSATTLKEAHAFLDGHMVGARLIQMRIVNPVEKRHL